MEDNEKLVEETENTEELTAEEIEDVEAQEEEPIEEQTEEQPKEEPQEPLEETFTKSQVDEMVAKKLARKEAKMKKDFAKKYGRLETVVNTGLGTNDVDEAVNKLTEFYKSKGIEIPNEPQYSDRDLEVLANDDANEIISLGYEDIVEEVDRLAQINPNNMTKREKLVFTKLANARKEAEEMKELEKIGVKPEDLDEDFKKYASELNPNLSLRRKYEKYIESKPKKEVKTIGSMTSKVNTNELKEFYTRDEALRFTEEDFEKNPKLEEIIEKSMTKW